MLSMPCLGSIGPRGPNPCTCTRCPDSAIGPVEAAQTGCWCLLLQVSHRPANVHHVRIEAGDEWDAWACCAHSSCCDCQPMSMIPYHNKSDWAPRWQTILLDVGATGLDFVIELFCVDWRLAVLSLYPSPCLFARVRLVVDDTAKVRVLLHYSHFLGLHFSHERQRSVRVWTKKSDFSGSRTSPLKNEENLRFARL